jgi:hypothetical protein
MTIKHLSTTILILTGLSIGVPSTLAQSIDTLQQPIADGSNGGQANGNAFNQGNAQTNQNNSNGQTNGQTNTQQIIYPNIPINPIFQSPVNTENDLGINLGGAINTLDGRNVTIFLGITYQPGRTDDHNARMAKLKTETQLLESQRNITQTQLQLLKQQVAEQEIRLKRLQSPQQVMPK